MELRGIDFGPIWGASGVQGFFGEGYKHHRLLALLLPGMFSFRGITFVAKTTTYYPKEGNMPLRSDHTPKNLCPSCVVVKKDVVLNAVGLSGPGAKILFAMTKWQRRTEPFLISFMSVAKAKDERISELKDFVRIFQAYLPCFDAPVGLQINFSCPNVGLNVASREFISEVETALDVAGQLGIPLVPKFSVTTSWEDVVRISHHANCDAVCVSNTIPWGKCGDKVDWKKYFGKEVSPLAQFGGGGLSGKPLFPIVVDWVSKAKAYGLAKPINAGGGILEAGDVKTLFDVGVDSVFVGTAAIIRPWRLQGIIKKAHECALNKINKNPVLS